MAFLRKYGTGTGADVIVPMIKRGVVDFAATADWTPASGDVKVSKDGGSEANIGTLPVINGTTGWKFVFSDAELQCKSLTVRVVDSATKAVEDQFFIVETYGNASAMYPVDLSASVLPVNVTHFGGTAGTFTSGKPDVQAAASVSGAVGSVTGSVGSVTGNVGGNVNGNVVGSVASVAGNVSGSVGSVSGAVGSVTGSVGSVVGSVGGSVASVSGAVGSVSGNVGGDVSGKVLGGGAGTISGDGVRAASVTGAVGSVTGSVGSVVGAVELDPASCLAIWNTLTTEAFTADSFGDLLIISDGTNGREVKVTGANHIAADVHEVQPSGLTASTDIIAIKAKTTNLPTDPADQSLVEAAITAATSPLATPAQVNAQVLDVLSVDTFGELSSPPAATSSLKDKLGWLFMWARNRSTQSATQRKLYADDATTIVSTETVGDDGATFTKGEAS